MNGAALHIVSMIPYVHSSQGLYHTGWLRQATCTIRTWCWQNTMSLSASASIWIIQEIHHKAGYCVNKHSSSHTKQLCWAESIHERCPRLQECIFIICAQQKHRKTSSNVYFFMALNWEEVVFFYKMNSFDLEEGGWPCVDKCVSVYVQHTADYKHIILLFGT